MGTFCFLSALIIFAALQTCEATRHPRYYEKTQDGSFMRMTYQAVQRVA